jgi:hypothetical protein
VKYIILRSADGSEHPVIFPGLWQHSDVAQRMALEDQQVVAAGFIRFNTGGDIECHGISRSLQIKSRPDTDRLIVMQLLLPR